MHWKFVELGHPLSMPCPVHAIILLFSTTQWLWLLAAFMPGTIWSADPDSDSAIEFAKSKIYLLRMGGLGGDPVNSYLKLTAFQHFFISNRRRTLGVQRGRTFPDLDLSYVSGSGSNAVWPSIWTLEKRSVWRMLLPLDTQHVPQKGNPAGQAPLRRIPCHYWWKGPPVELLFPAYRWQILAVREHHLVAQQGVPLSNCQFYNIGGAILNLLYKRAPERKQQVLRMIKEYYSRCWEW